MSASAADLQSLYAQPPSEFVAARNALVQQLKREGNTAAAAAVKALRRPSVTAWALNQLGRTQPIRVAAVADAGRRFEAAARTGDRDEIRASQATVRDAIEGGVNAAASVLDAAGHTTTDRTRQILANTLRASIGDKEVAAELAAGVLAADRGADDFGLDSLVDVPAVARPSRRPPKVEQSSKEREEKVAALLAEADRLEARAAELRRQALC